MIELCLVNPNGRIPAPFAAIEPPLWLGLIAGYHLNLNKSIRIVNFDIEMIDSCTIRESERIIIVCMGNNPSVSSTPKWPMVEELLRWFPSASVTGLHPVAINYPRYIKTPFEGTPSIPWDKFDLNKYRAHNWHCLDDVDKRSPYAVLYTSLNCPYNCFYCNVHTLYGDHRVRYRPLDDVYKELDYFAERGIHNIKIWDECFTMRPDRVIKICDYIIGHQYSFNMWAYGRIDQADTVMLSKMQLAGIRWIAYGFESMNDRKSRKAEMPLQITRECGLNILGNFMFGLPGEIKKDWQASYDYACQNNFEWVNFQVGLPYPGSGWWDSLIEKPTEWARFSQFHPNMYGDPGAIKFRDYAFKDYFGRPEYLSMIKRKFSKKAEAHIKEMLAWHIR